MAATLYARSFTDPRQIVNYVNENSITQDDIQIGIDWRPTRPGTCVVFFWWDPENHEGDPPPPSPGVKT